ncbi:MAG: zinc ribbon domain-containing protein [Candidatus Thorarchaeota archaeon]|jgi:transposase
MALSKGVIISVKVPINWEVMTERKKKRLRQMVGRDTRVIRAFLGIIERYEDKLLTGRNKQRIADGKLDQLTMTALKVKSGYEQRPTVPHDLKVRYPRMSQNELAECRKTAVSLYESYLKLRGKRAYNATRPTRVSSSRRIPRWIFTQRFKLIKKETSVATWWVDLRDSLDSAPEKKRVHDRLLIPLKMSPFHITQFSRGEVKALQIFSDDSQKWWVTFAVNIKVPDMDDNQLPPAVLGIDLGIEKAACISILTPQGVKETRFFKQRDKIERIKVLDRQVAELQRRLAKNEASGVRRDNVISKLRLLKHKRENVSKEYDRVLIRELLDYIETLSEKYTLFVSIGRLKHIRQRARKGNYRGRVFRGLIHSWAFSRITTALGHNLAQLGWSVSGKDSQFRVVPENWTSIMCWKCGRKGRRPRQNLFVCPTCGNKCNADMNGAINIAARLLTLTKSLHSVRGLGKWNDAIQRAKHPPLKTQGKKPSRGKSLLSSMESTSDSGESAAVHQTQTSLLGFSDETELCDNDPAVGRTVETLSVTDGDASVVKQETEIRSIGGSASQ